MKALNVYGYNLNCAVCDWPIDKDSLAIEAASMKYGSQDCGVGEREFVWS